jgi:hypothetical protein
MAWQKGLQLLRGSQLNGLDDIGARSLRQRRDRVAQIRKHLRRQMGDLHRFGHHLRGQEQALKQKAVEI